MAINCFFYYGELSKKAGRTDSIDRFQFPCYPKQFFPHLFENIQIRKDGDEISMVGKHIVALRELKK